MGSYLNLVDLITGPGAVVVGPVFPAGWAFAAVPGHNVSESGSDRQVITGASGQDSVSAESGHDVDGGGGRDSNAGSSGADVIFCDEGEVRLDSGSNADTLDGRSGFKACAGTSGAGRIVKRGGKR